MNTISVYYCVWSVARF